MSASVGKVLTSERVSVICLQMIPTRTERAVDYATWEALEGALDAADLSDEQRAQIRSALFGPIED